MLRRRPLAQLFAVSSRSGSASIRMRPIFQPQLVNDPFGDPGVILDFAFEARALLFDLGDITRLAPRKILRLSHVFVSHAHMDHFMGFDWLLRISLGRETGITLFGPSGFIDQVQHKLAAYTWNLVERYPGGFTVVAHELQTDQRLHAARFRCKTRFVRENLDDVRLVDGVLLDEPGFRVRAGVLDHATPCLGYLVEEKLHVNVWKNRLTEMGLPVGPWLKDLKAAVIADLPHETTIPVRWREGPQIRERHVTIGELRSALAIVPGQRICYITDVVYEEENVRRMVALARDADLLFIEAVFLDRDAELGARKYHLTARQAGVIARAANARAVIPFHFSPRYSGREAELREELEQAFRGG